MAHARFDHCSRTQSGSRSTPKKGGAEAQGLGRSRGGLTTKACPTAKAGIHAASDALGLPMRLIGGPGQQSGVARAHDLIDGFKPGHVIAGKGYDAGHLIDAIVKRKAEAVIPQRNCWKTDRAYGADLYKERNRIERFFNKLKQFRRVATRYDKLLANFMGFVKIAAIAIWLKELNGHYSLEPASGASDILLVECLLIFHKINDEFNECDNRDHQ